MWLLIEVKDMMDAGKNEQQRIVIKDGLFDLKQNFLGEAIFLGFGNVFHPITESE